jgi:hypothetical protein
MMLNIFFVKHAVNNYVKSVKVKIKIYVQLRVLKDTMCEKGCWNDQIHNDNTTWMTKYEDINRLCICALKIRAQIQETERAFEMWDKSTSL